MRKRETGFVSRFPFSKLEDEKQETEFLFLFPLSVEQNENNAKFGEKCAFSRFQFSKQKWRNGARFSFSIFKNEKTGNED